MEPLPCAQVLGNLTKRGANPRNVEIEEVFHDLDEIVPGLGDAPFLAEGYPLADGYFLAEGSLMECAELR